MFSYTFPPLPPNPGDPNEALNPKKFFGDELYEKIPKTPCSKEKEKRLILKRYQKGFKEKYLHHHILLFHHLHHLLLNY